MKNIIKALAASALVLCAGCGSSSTGEAMVTTLVQGNLDSLYKGQYNKAYMELVQSDEATEQTDYEDNMEYNAEYFAQYFGITDDRFAYDQLSFENHDRMIALMKEIYSKTKYTVRDAVKQDDDSYTVQVLIQPVDVISQAYDVLSAVPSPIDDFNADYTEEQVADMNAEEFADYSNGYADTILTVVEGCMDSLGYEEEKSLSVQVTKDSDDMATINVDDFQRVDAYLVDYPQ